MPNPLRLVPLVPLALVALVATGCTDDGPLLFPPPAQVVPLVEGTPSAQVGQRITLGPVLYLEDRYGNRVPGVRIPVAVVVGDGRLDRDFAVSDAQGRVAPPALVLDTIVGENRIEIRIPGLPPHEFVVEGTAGLAHHVVSDPDSTFLGTVEVGSVVPSPVEARILDEYGNPVPNFPVLFVPLSGGGRAGEGGLPGQPDAALIRTDADGFVSVRWTVGEEPGTNRLGVRTDFLPSRIYEAEAVAGPLDALSPLSPQSQTAQISESAIFPPGVRAEDRFGNPLEGVEVNFEVVEGGSTVSPPTITTDATGRAETTEWIMGPDEGVQTVRASAGGFETLFNAQAGSFPPGPPVQVAAVHINQGAQTLDGTVDLVAGRPGLLRVFLSAPDALDLRPEVEIELWNGGVLLERTRISASSDSIRTVTVLEPAEWSWNLAVDGGLVRPGLGVRVTVDPDGEIWEDEGTGPAYPTDGGILPFPVVELDPLELLLVPVEQAPTGLVGRVDETNADIFVEDTRRMHPVSEVEWQLRAPYTTQVRVTNDFGTWVELLGELLAVRTDEESGRRYWYGVLQTEYSSGIAGIGYILPNAEHPDRLSLGWDRPNTAGYIAAHELGHNLGRRHAPCQVSQSLDQNYPYPAAGIGTTGWDRATGELRSSATHFDFMSYCRPEWISDYTFAGLLERFSQLSALETALAEAPRPGLMVWGRIDRDGLHLEPAFPSQGPPALPREPGPYRITGFDAQGGQLFQLDFRGTPIDHASDPSARHFAFRVPLDTATHERLDRIELEGGGAGRTTLESGLAAGALRTDPSTLSAERVAPDLVRLEWDASIHPLLVVRAPDGRILTLARGGRAEVRTSADRLHLQLSRGITSDELELPIPR